MHRVIHSFSAFLRESRRAAASADGRAEAGRRRPEARGFAPAGRTYPLFHTVIHIPLFIMRPVRFLLREIGRRRYVQIAGKL